MKIFSFFILVLFISFNAFATNYCYDSSILACYPAQEGSGVSLIDNSSQGNNGTFASSGHPSWVLQSPPNRLYLKYALSYSTSSDYINLPSMPIYLSGDPMSEVFWIYPTTDTINGGGPRLIDRQASLSEIATTHLITINVHGSTTTLVVETSNNANTLNAWNHIAITWTGSSTATTMKIYINGVQASYQGQTNGNGLDTSNSSQIQLGNRASDEARNLDGYITEIGIFSRVLSSSEITDIYNNGLLQANNNTLINNAVLNQAVIQ